MARTRVCRSRSFHVPGHRSLAAVCALVLLLATGCSEESRLDRESLQTQIQAELFSDYEGLVSAANCPELVDPVPGQRFVCAAQVGSQIIVVPVELGGTAEALTADIALDERFVEAREIAVMLAETFTAEIGIETLVDCGQPIVVLESGQQLRCDAIDPSGVVRQFDVLVDDTGRLVLAIR